MVPVKASGNGWSMMRSSAIASKEKPSVRRTARPSMRPRHSMMDWSASTVPQGWPAGSSIVQYRHTSRPDQKRGRLVTFCAVVPSW